VGVATAAVPTDSSALRNAVNSAGILKHENELQKIANQNKGTRAASTPGYDASAKYVYDKLRGAGYTVAYQPFEFPFFQETGPATFERLTPTAQTYVKGEDYDLMEFSGSGDVIGQIVPTNDIVIPPGNQEGTSNSGCEPEDFQPASTTEDQVALIQRGTCDFVVKVKNAKAAGYDAAIIFNEGQEGRTDIIEGTLGEPVDIPALDTTFAVGEELYELASAGSTTVHIVTQTFTDTRTTKNVIADYPGGRMDRTVVVGAHLDSVPEGPGINDNGSGSAGILEIALQMKKLNIKPTNHVRFAFWGAEEEGLLGSTYYVTHLSADQKATIALNLNFDMLGSPNGRRGVYDGDDSEGAGTNPPAGSGAIEKVFLDYYGGRSLRTSPSTFDGRSDYGPFIDNGIPAGGLDSGAEGLKTPEEAAIYGGEAGKPYDGCYHQACDTYDNNNSTILDQLSDGAAHAVQVFAKSTLPVNGDRIAARKAVTRTVLRAPAGVDVR
jgi:Zn-dependent M28 family amino/carboxypeptidase